MGYLFYTYNRPETKLPNCINITWDKNTAGRYSFTVGDELKNNEKIERYLVGLEKREKGSDAEWRHCTYNAFFGGSHTEEEFQGDVSDYISDEGYEYRLGCRVIAMM